MRDFLSPSLIYPPPLLDLKKKSPNSLCSVPPTRQNKRYIHLFQLAVAETLRRISWALLPFQLPEHNAIHATGRKQTQRLLLQPNNVENVRYFLRLESTALDRCLCAVPAEVVHVSFHPTALIFQRSFCVSKVSVQNVEKQRL